MHERIHAMDFRFSQFRNMRETRQTRGFSRDGSRGTEESIVAARSVALYCADVGDAQFFSPAGIKLLILFGKYCWVALKIRCTEAASFYGERETLLTSDD